MKLANIFAKISVFLLVMIVAIVYATGSQPVVTTHNLTAEYPVNISVLFNTTGNGTTLVNSTLFTINQTGFLFNISDLPPLPLPLTNRLWINLSSNESEANLTHNVILWVNITDLTAPAIVSYNVSRSSPALVNAWYNYSDNYLIDSFSVNDTTNWQINATGNLYNITHLAPGTHWIIITLNDTWNNTITTEVNALINDTVIPNILAHNISTAYEDSIAVQFNGTDNYLIDTFSINDTTNFQINKTGYFQNKISLAASTTYWINISLNDTENQIAYTVIHVDVAAAVITTTSESFGSPTTVETTTETTTETTISDETTTIAEETTIIEDMAPAEGVDSILITTVVIIIIVIAGIVYFQFLKP